MLGATDKQLSSALNPKILQLILCLHSDKLMDPSNIPIVIMVVHGKQLILYRNKKHAQPYLHKPIMLHFIFVTLFAFGRTM
ncbi:hypothetical protein BFS25_04565 [Bifidobacterium longum subsp. infantis]|nr:hypothetical protein BFS25_04565 [Bifidobacterium longum subsp. infantis]